MRRLRTPRAIGCIEELPDAASEGRSTYFNERSCEVWSAQWSQHMWAKETYQKERVCHESVSEDRPADHSSGSLAAVGNRRDSDSDDDADEFVAGVGDQVVDLALGVDVEEVPPQPEKHEFKYDDDASVAECDAEQLGLEFAVQAGDHGGQQDVGREGHDGDVHVGAVDVVSWGEERGCAA